MKLEMIDAINDIASNMKSEITADKLQMYLSQFKQEDLEVVDKFAPGIYIRELHMPAGTWVVGKKHKTKHFNQVLQGECIVKIGNEEQHIKAPFTFVSKEGDKKIIFALEDTIWATIHPTEETDVDKIELEVIDTEYENMLEQETKHLLAS